MKKSTALFVTVIFLLSSGNIFSQTTIFGGRGLLRTHSAEMIGKSNFYVNSFFMTFFQAEKSQASLGKDYTLTLGFTYGLSRYWEITSLLTPYQDDQTHIWGPPGDTQLGIKFRTPFSSSTIMTAGRVFINVPTARNNNVPFEPYSSGKIGIGLMGIATFDMTNSFPLFPLKMHINFGYMDHNASDSYFTDIEDQFFMRLGFKFPIRSSVLFTEYSAEIFAQNPIVSQRSFNSQRITQGLKFLGPWNLVFDLAIDVSLSQTPEPTSMPFLKKYADWKVIAGVNYPMTLRKKDTARPDRLIKKQQDEDKKKLQEVHDKRQKVDEEIKKMEESLKTGDKKKKKNKSDNGKQ